MIRLLWIAIYMVANVTVRAQIVSTFAGNGTNANTGDGGTASAAGIYNPFSIVFDRHGNCYMSSRAGHKIRKIESSGLIATIAGTGVQGYNGDGGLADTSKLQQPMGITVDTIGNLYIADILNNRVRKIDVSTGIITTIAGTGTAGFSGDGGLATSAQLRSPNHLCFDKAGNLYIIDQDNYRIRKINLFGIISTVVGTGVSGNNGDGGLAVNAQINLPFSITTDDSQNLFLADYSGASNCIRKVDISTGIISKYAGTGSHLYNGEGLPALAANITVVDIEFDKYGNLFFSDRVNHRVRKIDKQTSQVNTVAGDGSEMHGGDGGIATSAQLYHVSGITFDSCNNLYICEGDQGRIRKVDFNPNCWPVSVNEHKQVSFSLYPNPSNDDITIAGNNLQTVSIINTLGQIVHWQKASAEKTLVDISSLNVGMYFVTVTDKQGAKVTKKVVKE